MGGGRREGKEITRPSKEWGEEGEGRNKDRQVFSRDKSSVQCPSTRYASTLYFLSIQTQRLDYYYYYYYNNNNNNYYYYFRW